MSKDVGRAAGRRCARPTWRTTSIPPSRWTSGMYKQDIEGSMAHAAMLGAKGDHHRGGQHAADRHARRDPRAILTAGKLEISTTTREDIHMFVEAGADRAHRRRRQAVCTPPAAATIRSRSTCGSICGRRDGADRSRSCARSLRWFSTWPRRKGDTILPGYTHLQRAQPITFGHHLLGLRHDAHPRHRAHRGRRRRA